MTEALPTQPDRLAVPLIRPAEQLKGAEFADLRRWLKEQVGKLPEMNVTKSSLTDTQSWKAKIGSDSSVDSISSPFFSLEGIDVSSGPHSWHQAAVVQRSEFLPTKSGEKAEVSGAVILLRNPKGETFVTLSQEPLAPVQYKSPHGELHSKALPGAKEVHPVVRSSIQTSVQKLQLVARSEALGRQYDPGLTAILTSLAKERKSSVTEILNATVFSKAPTDGNRIDSNVVYGQIDVSEKFAKDLSAAVPDGRWCSQKELDALVIAGLTNGHLNVGRSVSEAQRRLSKAVSR